MTLRDYQQQSVKALMTHFCFKTTNPCLVVPTGGGKSVILAAFINECLKRWPSLRFCVLAHVGELVQQNAEKLQCFWPELAVGIFSAGLGRKEHEEQVVFASIQSIAKRSFDKVGGFDVVLIDEAHRIPAKGEGLYRQFLKDQWKINQQQGKLLKIAGLTATPYRTGIGEICAPKHVLNEICYEVSVKQLISEGYLCEPISAKGTVKTDFSSIRTQQGEFASADLEVAMTQDDHVALTVKEIVEQGHDRKRWIIFCVTVKHAQLVSEALQEHGIHAPVIEGKTPAAERKAVIQQFNEGELRCIVNCSVLTEGFDSPAIDLVVLLRPTKSPGLYLQMIGRGLRLAEGKTNCLVLDFGGNISRHGPIDSIEVRKPKEGKAPKPKSCPECGFDSVPLASQSCPECGFEFDIQVNESFSKIDLLPSKQEILSTPAKEYQVSSIKYQFHPKPEGTDSLRVIYQCGPLRKFSEWICLLHEGFAGEKAKDWWHSVSQGGEYPQTIWDAIDAGEAGELQEPYSILVDENGRYPKIVKRLFDTPQQKAA